MNGMPYADIKEGAIVRAFDPRTLGVVRTGRVVSRNARHTARVDFGLHGVARVALRDVVEVVETAERAAFEAAHSWPSLDAVRAECRAIERAHLEALRGT